MGVNGLSRNPSLVINGRITLGSRLVLISASTPVDGENNTHPVGSSNIQGDDNCHTLWHADSSYPLNTCFSLLLFEMNYKGK